MVQFQSGQNSPDLNPVLPGESATDQRNEPPAASVVRRPRPGLPGLSGQGLPGPSGQGLPGLGGQSPLQGLPVQNLPLLGNGGLPLIGGLLPSGPARSFAERPSMRQAEMFDGGLPLLGGLGGLLPANGTPRTPTGEGPDVSGMPAGGLAILPAAATGKPATAPAVDVPARPADPDAPAASDAPAAPDAEQPAQDEPDEPQKAKPRPAETPEDPRLHEEPVDDDTTAEADRPFSSEGRPVAGVDEQYR
jgi:hypothetical protein